MLRLGKITLKKDLKYRENVKDESQSAWLCLKRKIT